MGKIDYLLIVFSLSILTACNSFISSNNSNISSDQTPPESTHQSNDSIQPNQEFSLTVGEKVQFQPAGVAIEFVEVKSDSRCPADVACVWAGEATVHIKSTTQGPDVNADLIIPGTQKNSIQLKGDVGSLYNLKFLDLKPYPNSKAATDNSAYKATFIFEEVK